MSNIVDIKASLLDSNIIDVIAHAIYKPTKEKMLARATSYIDNNTIYAFGYKIDNKIVGVIIINKHDNTPTIMSIAVTPTYRKMGIGKKLIHYALTNPDIKSLEAETDDDAVDFYRRCCFCIEDLGLKYENTRRYRCTITKI